eukprot:Sspe_Gene.54::Locus_20_Transcript_10_12_Confidence_0.286_Length_1111::g.54::m.54
MPKTVSVLHWLLSRFFIRVNMADATVEEPTVVAVEEDAEPEDLLSALQQVLKKARFHGGLCRVSVLHWQLISPPITLTMAEEEPTVAAVAVDDDAEPEDLLAALQQVLKKARFHGGLCRGLAGDGEGPGQEDRPPVCAGGGLRRAGVHALIDALCTAHGIDITRVP